MKISNILPYYKEHNVKPNNLLAGRRCQTHFRIFMLFFHALFKPSWLHTNLLRGCATDSMALARGKKNGTMTEGFYKISFAQVNMEVWVHRDRQVDRWQARNSRLQGADDQQHLIVAPLVCTSLSTVCTLASPEVSSVFGVLQPGVACRQHGRKSLRGETFLGAVLCFLAAVSLETQSLLIPLWILVSQNLECFSLLI